MIFDLNVTVKLETFTCTVCGAAYAVETGLVATLRNNAGQSFYCPRGHGQSFKESRADVLAREVDRLKAELSSAFGARNAESARADGLERRIVSLKGTVTRLSRKPAPKA